MASEREKARTAWKNTTTTTGTPRKKTGTALQRGEFDPNAADKRIEQSVKARATTTPKPKPKPEKTVTAPTKKAEAKKTTTTSTKQTEKGLTALLKEQGDNSITTSVRSPEDNSLGMGGLGGRFDPTMQEATAMEQQPVQAPQGGGGGDPLAPLPPAEELPPDAPLWLKLIRGVLTPVPPLAMIPHMFIQGMEQRRYAAQQEDNKNMKYFWEQYDNNPIAAAELAKTPLFRDTLQRKHGFTAQDLQDIAENAKAQPYKSSELAQMISSGAVDRTAEQSGTKQGDRKLGRIEQPISLSKGESLYDPEKNEMLFNAAQEERKAFHEVNKKDNPNATELESMILQKNLSGNKEQVKWMVAGDKIVAYDATIPYQKMIKDKAYQLFNNKNTGKSEVLTAKDGLGATIGWTIVDVENGVPVIGEDGQPTGEVNYPKEYIDLDELLLNRLAQEFDGKDPPSPQEARNFVQETYDAVMKNLVREIGGDIKGDQELSSLIMQDVLEQYLQMRNGGSPGLGGPAATPTTTNTVSPEVQQYQ